MKRYLYVDEYFDKAAAIEKSSERAEYLKSINEPLMKMLAKAICENKYYVVDTTGFKHNEDFEPWSNLQKELRLLYLFTKGNPSADKLTDVQRRNLLLQYTERLSKGEAEIFVAILKGGNFPYKGLSKAFFKKYFLEK